MCVKLSNNSKSTVMWSLRFCKISRGRCEPWLLGIRIRFSSLFVRLRTAVALINRSSHWLGDISDTLSFDEIQTIVFGDRSSLPLNQHFMEDPLLLDMNRGFICHLSAAIHSRTVIVLSCLVSTRSE